MNLAESFRYSTGNILYQLAQALLRRAFWAVISGLGSRGLGFWLAPRSTAEPKEI